MSLTIPVKLSQTTVVVGLLLAAGIFVVGFLAGRYEESATSGRQINDL